MSEEQLTRKDIHALPHHPDWYDGRDGFLYCRFDATLSDRDDPRHLRAEITWEDNLDTLDDELEQNEIDRQLRYTRPELRLETNRRRYDGSLETVDGLKIELTQAAAAALLTEDPKSLLVAHKDKLETLQVKV